MRACDTTITKSHPRPWRTAFASAALCGALAAGCDPTRNDDEASHRTGDEKLTAMVSKLWQLKDFPLSVCFRSDSDDTGDREHVRRAVEGAWVANSRVIRFEGWGDCANDDDGADIRIQLSSAVTRSEAPYGTDNRDRRVWIKLRTPSSPDGTALDYAYIHEFGHALGFQHEQAHPDKDPACTEVEALGAGRPVTAYDPNSILNYCAGRPGALSPLDIRGSRALYAPSTVMSWTYYHDFYPDLARAFKHDQREFAYHWARYGIDEGRASAPTLNVTDYLILNPDVARAFGASNYADAHLHFQTFGLDEGRRGSLAFDPQHYLRIHPDLVAAFGATGYAAATQHFIDHGLGEGRESSPVFDAEYYLKTFDPEVYSPITPESAMIHWQQVGLGEGRQAHPTFNPGAYLERYPDLRAAFGEDYRAAAIHYLMYGIAEGRDARSL